MKNLILLSVTILGLASCSDKNTFNDKIVAKCEKCQDITGARLIISLGQVKIAGTPKQQEEYKKCIITSEIN